MRFGLNQTDNEQRINFDRLRKERLAKAQQALANSEADALLTRNYREPFVVTEEV